MNTKALVLLFALIATGQTANTYQSKLKGDQITDSLANLLEYVARAVNALNLKLKDIDFSDAGFIKYIQAVALDANKEVINIMDTIRNDTTKTGKVIIDCFKAQREIVETNLNETVKEIGQCVNKPMAGVKWYMDEYIEGMDWIYNNLNTYAKDLRACDNVTALVCIPEVMEKNGLTLPTLISYAGGRVMEIAIGVIGGVVVVGDLKDCGKSVLDKRLESNLKQVFNGAVICIDKNLSS